MKTKLTLDFIIQLLETSNAKCRSIKAAEMEGLIGWKCPLCSVIQIFFGDMNMSDGTEVKITWGVLNWRSGFHEVIMHQTRLVGNIDLITNSGHKSVTQCYTDCISRFAIRISRFASCRALASYLICIYFHCEGTRSPVLQLRSCDCNSFLPCLLSSY